MKKKKSIQERLAAKYKKSKKFYSRFDKNIEVTLEEEEWIKNNENEAMRIFNAAEKSTYAVNAMRVVDGEVQLVMGW